MRAIVARKPITGIGAEAVAGQGQAHAPAQTHAAHAGRHRPRHGRNRRMVIGRHRHPRAGMDTGGQHAAAYLIGHHLLTARPRAGQRHAAQRARNRGRHGNAVQARGLGGCDTQAIRNRDDGAVKLRLHAGRRDIADIGGADRHRAARDRHRQRSADRFGIQLAVIVGRYRQARHLRTRA